MRPAIKVWAHFNDGTEFGTNLIIWINDNIQYYCYAAGDWDDSATNCWTKKMLREFGFQCIGKL
jgi:hypothetical protein